MNFLQVKTTDQTLGAFNTVKKKIIEALEDHNKEKVNTNRVEVMSNSSSTQNDVLLTLTQFIAALTKEFQSMKKHKIGRVKNK